MSDIFAVTTTAFSAAHIAHTQNQEYIYLRQNGKYFINKIKETPTQQHTLIIIYVFCITDKITRLHWQCTPDPT
jgi:hypothetical protein